MLRNVEANLKVLVDVSERWFRLSQLRCGDVKVLTFIDFGMKGISILGSKTLVSSKKLFYIFSLKVQK